MEYRSLFETDTESLLNEIGTLDQQNNQQTVYNSTTSTTNSVTNTQTMPSYSSQQILNPHQLTSQTHMNTSYQTNMASQQSNLLPGQPTQASHHLNQSHLQQQNMASPYMMTQNQSQYYQQANNQMPSNMLVTQTLKNSNMSYMHSPMGPPPTPQTNQTQQPPPQAPTPNMPAPPINGTQNVTPNSSSTTIQNVQINVQNNFNIAKNIQQMPGGVNPTTTSTVINGNIQNPNQMTPQQAAWNMPTNSQYQTINPNSNITSSQLQYKSPASQIPPQQSPVQMSNVQQSQMQSQQLMKMNQYNINKPSTPPQSMTQSNYVNPNLNQSYQTGQIMNNKTQVPPQSINAYPQNQTVNPQMNQQQHQQIPATHSTYQQSAYNQMSSNPQINQQQAKLSAIPPHMQYPPNQQQSIYNGSGSPVSSSVNGQQIRPQITPNQLQMPAYQQQQVKTQQSSIPMQSPNVNVSYPQNSMLGVNVNQNCMSQSQISPNRSTNMSQQTGYYQQQMPPNQTSIYTQYQQPQQNQYLPPQQPISQQNYSNYQQQSNINAYQNPNMINQANRMNYPSNAAQIPVQSPSNNNLQPTTPVNNNYQLATNTVVDPNSSSTGTITTTTNEIQTTPTKGRGKGKNKANSNGLSPETEQTEPKTKGKRGPGKNSKKNQEDQQKSEQTSSAQQTVTQSQQFQQPSQSNQITIQQQPQQYQNINLKPSPTQNKTQQIVFPNSSPGAVATPLYANSNLNMTSPLLRQDLTSQSPSSLSPNTHTAQTPMNSPYQMSMPTNVYQQQPNQIMQPQSQQQYTQPSQQSANYSQTVQTSMYMQPPQQQVGSNQISQQQYMKKPEDLPTNTYIPNSNISKPSSYQNSQQQPSQNLNQMPNQPMDNSSSSINTQQPLMASPQLVNNTNTNNSNSTTYPMNSYNTPPSNYNNQHFTTLPKPVNSQESTLMQPPVNQSQPIFIQPSNVQLNNNIHSIQSNELQNPSDNATSIYQAIPTSTLNQTQLIANNNSSSVQYSVNSTVSFMDQQQQLINDNLNQSNSTTSDKKQSPSKKLTKKQMLQQGLTDDSDNSQVKKTQRKIRPKKDSLNNSISSSSSTTDISLLNNSSQHLTNTSNSEIKPQIDPTETANTNEASSNLSATTNANIEATIDDLMKQYKSKNKKSKVKDDTKQSGDEGDSEDEGEEDEQDDEENDETFAEPNAGTDQEETSGKAKKQKNPRRQNRKKKLNETNGENSETVIESTEGGGGEIKKKRKYTKKKPTISQMDELSMSTQDATNLDSNLELSNLNKPGDESLSQAAADNIDETAAKKQRGKKTKEPNSEIIIASNSRSGVGRKKSSAQLVKLMKKRKKRKRTSSGEEEVDDDSDEYELPMTTSNKNSKKEESLPVNGNEGITSDGVTNLESIQNDEAAAKLLQANENRRSTRAKATKKAKYTDEIKDEDLLLPPTEADLAAETESAATQNSNIVLTSQDSLIVDKILGMRLFKRKTIRKKEKKYVEKTQELMLTKEVEKSENKEITKMEVDETNEISHTMKESINKAEKFEISEVENDTEPVKATEEIKPKVIDKKESLDEIKLEEEKTDNSKIIQNCETIKDEEVKNETAKIAKPLDDVKDPEIEEGNKEDESNKMETSKIEEAEEVESEYEEDGGEIEVEEFFVKYKNFSYIHCEWRTRDELFASDKRIDQKIKRYKLKKSQQTQYDWSDNNNEYNNDEDELFNPDYVEVDRILDVYDMEDSAEPNTKHRYLLIKWKTLPYDESSWELEQDIKAPKKIERFYKFNTLVPEVHQKFVPRPKSDRWYQQQESRVYKNGNQLREYQLEGINWLTFCWLNGRNCILADEMGLGKTIQSITFLQEIAHYGVNGPFLVLVPLSTIGNWMREFETWTDFNAIVYHGSSTSRQMIQDYEFYFKENGTSPEVSNSIAINTDSSRKNIVKFNALITTYEVLLSDVQLFCQFKWRNVIIDEAHRLKNKNCKLMEGLRYMDVEHKVLLTGTPLQNNVEELFSLLHFLEPQQFNSSQEFLEEFGDLKTDTQVTKLQAVLKPMMLRRLKEDVEKNLAAKEETIVEVELTNTQKKYYRAILEKNFEFLYKGATNSNMPSLMNTMMELRKCCNHPYLIDGAEDQIVSEHLERNKLANSNEIHDKVALKAMVQASGKLVLVDKLLPKLKAGGHKVLIFSQMIRVLDILEDYLIQMRFTYERLDGRIRGEMRQEAIDRYSKPDSDRFAFLLCTRAGGLGINLTAADTVIIYDSDWNPQNDLQAQARCHRIGQKKSVKIYRLITRNTYEREMFDRASLKLGLDKAILQSMRNEDKFNQTEKNNQLQLSKKEIEDLLKKGAYGAIMEDDTVADKFCEEDIDKILQQRTTVIQIEGGEKGSTFSKASFQTSETNDISIDDPEFWQKWAKKADIDLEEKLNPRDERIIYEPRRRTQTRRYGGPDDLLDEVSDYSSSDTDENNENKDQTEKDPNAKDGKKKGKKSKRGRNADGDFGEWNDTNNNNEPEESNSVWSRDECYKVEKNLLVFGWSRWNKILKHCEFSTKKKGGVQSEQDVESLSRCIIAYVLKNFHGDESLKQFALELIDPYKSKFPELGKNFGLSGPAPKVSRRGRSRKEDKRNAKLIYDDDHIAEQVKLALDDLLDKVCTSSDEAETKSDNKEEIVEPKRPIKSPEEHMANLISLEWAHNADDLLGDENYKKHLVRQANRILLKLKTLSYIKNDIIGDENAVLIDDDINESEITIKYIDLPEVLADLPAEWWDKSCDKSMVIGVFKHGYEKYYKMRLDPTLVFLSLCGPPDAKDLLAEQQQENEDMENGDPIDTDLPTTTTAAPTPKSKGRNKNKNVEKKFPSVSELNNRLRRLIASHQKFKKQELLMSKRNAERQEKRLSKLASTQERAVIRQMEKQSKWSRREEQNFYRAISSFGVDCIDKKNNIYSWDRFKEIAQLDKKLDDTLTDYFVSFYYMCKKVCNKLSDDELMPVSEVQVEIISEERATRCIQRVELLNKVRIDVLKHEHFEDWITTRCMPSGDLPDWYIHCKHDIDLVRAAAKYGITRTEFYYLNDTEFTFKESLGKYMKHIEDLMNEDNKNDLSGNVNTDPIQYYFQNQSKIQQTYKELLSREAKKKEELEVIKETLEEEIRMEDEEEIEESKLEDSQIIKLLLNSIVDQIEDPSKTKSPCKMSKKKPIKKEKLKAEPAVEQTKTEENSSFFNNSAVPMIMWPKDRVITNRLESIIYMFENNGEWPQRSLFNFSNGNPLPNTPTSNLLSNSLSISNLIMSNVSQLTDQRKSMISPMLVDNSSIDLMSDDYYDQENSNNDPDFYGQSSRYQKPKRGRPPKLDLPQIASSLGVISSSSTTGIPSDPAHKIRNLLASDSNGRFNNYDGNSSDDENDDYMIKKSTPTPKENKPSGFLEPGEILRSKSRTSSKPTPFGLPDLDINELKKTQNNNNNSSSNKRMSKQPVIDSNSPPQGTMSFSDEATATALAAMFLAPGQDPDERITVVNVENGTRLTGNKAPKRSELPIWLISHPNYLPDEQEIINLALKNSLMTAAAAAANEEIDRNQRLNKSSKLPHQSTARDFVSKDYEDSLSPLPPPNTSRSFMESRSKSGQQNLSDSKSKNLNESRINQSTGSNNDKSNNKNSSNDNSNDNYYPDIILFNKQNGKKITGAKVPTWKALGLFFEKNTHIFIDPSCNETVKAKFGRNPIPDIIKSRLINPSSKTKSNQRQDTSPPQQQQQSKQPVISSTSSNQLNKSKLFKKEEEIEDKKLSNKQLNEQAPMFNPFSPSSAAQLQGLTDLLGAAAGDFNNPLAGLSSFMAAAMAAQNSGDPSASALPFGGLGTGAPGFNPFLLPPFGPPPGSSAGALPGFNPLLADIFKDLGGKMPNGLDMNSLEDLAMSLANGQQSKASNEQASNNSNKPKEENKPKSQPLKETHEVTRDLRKKPPPPPSQSISDRKNISDRHNDRNDRNDLKQKDSKSISSSNSRPSSVSSSLNGSKPSANDSKSSNNNSHKQQQQSQQSNKRPNSENASTSRHSTKERNSDQIDSNANVAALAASMMEQEKFMQEMMNLSQFAGLQNNPFFSFNPTGGFPTPPIPGLPPLPSNSKSSRTTARSPSPANSNARDRSISPASSIASNLSQQPPLDINLFMNNLLNYQMLGSGASGGAGVSSFAPPIPPPLLPGLPGMPSDLSKMPVDFLAALTAAASQNGGMGALDPNLFGALAQINSLSANAINEEAKESSHKSKSSSSSLMTNKSTTSKPSSHHSIHSSNGSSSQNKQLPSKSSSSSSNQKSSSSSSSSSHISKTNSLSKNSSGSSSNIKKSSNEDIYHGLDLTVRRGEDSKSKQKQSKH